MQSEAQLEAYYRWVACKIIERAIRDARNDNEYTFGARLWLTTSDWAADLLAWVAPSLRVDMAELGCGLGGNNGHR